MGVVGSFVKGFTVMKPETPDIVVNGQEKVIEVCGTCVCGLAHWKLLIHGM